jgi:hypothetical protein
LALVATLLIMSLMSALAIALTASGRIEVAMGDNEGLYARTRAAAESGLNHASAVITQLTSNPAFPVTSLLAGPDGLADAASEDAAVNDDNGVLTHIMGGGVGPWPLADGYSYDVRLLDDDDPALKDGTPFTGTELAAMGAGRPLEAEDGLRFSDVNRRLVIRATGFGPNGAVVRLEQTLTPIAMPALLVNGDVLIGGGVRVIGPQGSIHANGNLRIDGTSVTISQNATASGGLLANADWRPGGIKADGMPTVTAPDIHAEDFFDEADFVLRSDGRITNRADSTVYCTAGAAGDGCLGVTPPGGSAAFGWMFSDSQWDLAQNNVNPATYYAEADVRISGSPGTTESPFPLTVLALGNIDVAGNPVLRPESTQGLQFVTNRDLFLHGSLASPMEFDGSILVREQADLNGNPRLTGQLIVQDEPSASALVITNSVAGGTTLSYNGTVEVVSYTVSGWREVR